MTRKDKQIPKPVFMRVFPPEFLREAAYRKVDVGEYLLPAPQSDDVGVWQTREQYADAMELCSLLQNKYPGGEDVLVEPPKR